MHIRQKLASFAVYPHYIRPSALAKLCVCPVKQTLSMDALDDELGGAAAQLGNLIHKAVEAYHKADPDGVNIPEMIKAGEVALREHAASFPQADREEAATVFTCYSHDPRNHRPVLKAEFPVEVYLPPHPTDHTQQPIYIKGKLDQYGIYNGYKSILDIKSGGSDGYSMIHEYFMQQAAYLLGALNAGLEVERVWVIRTKGYRVRGAVLPSPDRVFWCMPLDKDYAWDMMDRVRIEVANIRNGELNFGPGAHCIWCEHGGLDACRPKLQNFLGVK